MHFLPKSYPQLRYSKKADPFCFQRGSACFLRGYLTAPCHTSKYHTLKVIIYKANHQHLATRRVRPRKSNIQLTLSPVLLHYITNLSFCQAFFINIEQLFFNLLCVITRIFYRILNKSFFVPRAYNFSNLVYLKGEDDHLRRCAGWSSNYIILRE